MIKMTLMWMARAALRASLRAYERVKTRVVILACKLGAAHAERQAATTPQIGPPEIGPLHDAAAQWKEVIAKLEAHKRECDAYDRTHEDLKRTRAEVKRSLSDLASTYDRLDQEAGVGHGDA